jgi:hypothetical protein
MVRKFHCKLEELPAVAEFISDGIKKDMDEFSKFSPDFNPDFVARLDSKIIECKKVSSSSAITMGMKLVTNQLNDLSKGLRVKLNVVEGYLKLGAAELDVLVADTGLKNVRNNISKGNIEGVISNTQKFIEVVKRNQNVLINKGMNMELINDIEKQIDDIDALNRKQNAMISDRNRLTKQNLELFNDLWDCLLPALNAAKAMFKGVDDVKLKDYTVTQLVKRINAES